jgi:hypothetical protein
LQFISNVIGNQKQNGNEMETPVIGVVAA